MIAVALSDAAKTKRRSLHHVHFRGRAYCPADVGILTQQPVVQGPQISHAAFATWNNIHGKVDLIARLAEQGTVSGQELPRIEDDPVGMEIRCFGTHVGPAAYRVG